MHSFGLQSALAIRRQRKRRAELKRHMERRRLSSQSMESGIHGSRSTVTSPTEYNGSVGNLSHGRRIRKRPPKMLDTKVVSSIGMLHVGVVFLVLGLFLIGSGIIPNDYVSWSVNHWFIDLIITGITSCTIGIFLIVLNYFINRNADSDLATYVERQLTRTRSGRRLVPDPETGAMHTKQQHRVRQQSQQQTSPGSDLVQIAEEDASGSEYRHIDRYNNPDIEIQNPGRGHDAYNRELLISVLHLAVVTILIGAILLIVGLVQLKPGADASEYKFVLIFSGLIISLIGIIMAIVRCCLLPWVIKRRQRRSTPSTPGFLLNA